MKFAKDAEGKRIKPFKHGRGICPVCESTVIARCGTKRAHHWAHEVLAKCEYSEYEHTHETPWHINWKNQFPEDWQEVILHALDGEKHISDVRTPHRSNFSILPFQKKNEFLEKNTIPALEVWSGLLMVREIKMIGNNFTKIACFAHTF